MRLYYSENEETVRTLAKLGKPAWQNPARTGRGAQNVKVRADLQWDVAKQANLWTSPDINAPDEQVTVCTTIKQDVEFNKVVYQEAEAQVITSNSPDALLSTGEGLYLCEASDDTPPIAKAVLHELVKSSCQLIFVGTRTIEWRTSCVV